MGSSKRPCVWPFTSVAKFTVKVSLYVPKNRKKEISHVAVKTVNDK